MQLEKQYRATPKKALLFINLILSQKGMPIQIWQHYERIKEKLEKKLQEQEAKSKAEAQIAASKKAKKQSKISALQVASPAVPTAAQEPAQVTAVITEPIELKKPERESPEPEEIPLTLSTGEESQQEAEQEIDMLQKKERAKSLFKEFEERLAIYSSNPKRIAYLKDARDVLTQIKALALSDEHEVKKIAKAEQRLNAAFGQQAQESSSSETSSSTSATSAATIVLDLFDVERDIPDALQKRFKEIKAALAYNSRCCEAEKIESSSYPLYRIRLGEYRLIYIITAKFIGILDLEKREETTYKKIDTKYKEKIKEYNELATINSAELTKRIEKEKALGHEK
jgi:mRNA-degrading endonuclease RelE of RelBE toxin-antitoxin system